MVRALEYMRAHLGDRFTLQDVASAAAVSRFHFARMFRVSTGRSPMEYLLQLRLDAARTLLRAGNTRIADIAATLGFCDQSHFTRTFRRATGLAPRDFARIGAELFPACAFEPMRASGRMTIAANDGAQSSAA